MTQTAIEQRSERSQNLKVFRVDDSRFFVESSEGKICYKVSLKDKRCTCGDFAANIQKDPKFRCKHLIAVMNNNGNYEQLSFPELDKPKLDKSFITSIQGNDFVRYAGLLDLAHQKGLKKLHTEVVQYPNSDNGNEAICEAVLESHSGEIFTDIGDANPKNVSKKVILHILRMASTRAKARTLRDFTNVGMTALEELGDLDDVADSEAPKSKRKSTSTKKTTASQSEEKAVEPKKETSGPQPSTAQMRAVENLSKRRGISSDELEELTQQHFGTGLNNLTSSEVSNFIRILQQSS